MIFRAEYYFLLNSYKEFKDNCRSYRDYSDNFYKVYHNVKYVDTFINRAETRVFIEDKSFIRRINYKDDSRGIYINQSIRDYWMNSCYYKRVFFWKVYIVNPNIDYLFRLKDDSFLQCDLPND